MTTFTIYTEKHRLLIQIYEHSLSIQTLHVPRQVQLNLKYIYIS